MAHRPTLGSHARDELGISPARARPIAAAWLRRVNFHRRRAAGDSLLIAPAQSFDAGIAAPALAFLLFSAAGPHRSAVPTFATVALPRGFLERALAMAVTNHRRGVGWCAAVSRRWARVGAARCSAWLTLMKDAYRLQWRLGTPGVLLMQQRCVPWP